MAITDIQISEELETNAPSIKYRGNEGPKSPQEMEMMMMSGGQPLPEDPTKPVNPFQPKPTGPVLPDKMMAGTDTPEIEIEMLQELLKLFREKFNRDPVSIDELKRAIGQMREKAAYGGIMGLDGRKQYGIGSWFQENIMDPIKENPLVAAAAAAAGVDYFGIPDYDILGDLGGLGGNKVLTGGNTIGELLAKKPGGDDADEDDKSYGEMITSAIGKNIIPIAGGLTAGLFTKNTESDTPGLPSDNTALQLADLKKTANLLDQKQGLAAGLNFLPTVASRKYSPAEMAITYQNAANGGRIGMAEGGIMDLGGMEKDYRAEGGFVPIGREEKADDVPARLSVNEFVFTADAVRNAGGGDIDEGARVMENMMKHLEAGGQVSEESQGMTGARDMFEVSERLSEVV